MTPDIGGTLGTSEAGDYIVGSYTEVAARQLRPRRVGVCNQPVRSTNPHDTTSSSLAARGPRWREYTGTLKDFSALELGAIAARAALERTGVKPEAVDHVVFGNVLQTSADAVYGARHVGLKAGLPIEVPALTVNRLCGSGIQAAVSGAQMIQLGEADVVLTGGMESMSQAPHVIRGLRSGLRLGQGAARGHAVVGAARHALRLHDGGDGRELRREVRHLARGAGSLRDPQPAARGQGVGSRPAWPTKSCRSRSSRAKASKLFAQDDHMRPDTTLEGLAKLPAAFSKNGCVTAGNASGIVDGGAALILASRARYQEHGLKPLGRLSHWAPSASSRASWAWGPCRPRARRWRRPASRSRTSI